MNTWNLKGKKALITGSSKGIGYAIAEEILELGAEIIICGRSQESLNIAENKLSKYNGRFFCISADVSDKNDRDRLFIFIKEKWNELDILINNAGTNIRKATMDYTDEELDFLYNLNYRSAMEMCRLAYPFLKKSDAPSIINIGSIAGSMVVRTGIAYAASKAGLAHLSRYLAAEWGQDGIRVNCIEPWYIRTPLTESVLNDPVKLKKIKEITPLGRTGEPAEIAGLTAFLCMPSAAYISGQVIAVDGAASVLMF